MIHCSFFIIAIHVSLFVEYTMRSGLNYHNIFLDTCDLLFYCDCFFLLYITCAYLIKCGSIHESMQLYKSKGIVESPTKEKTVEDVFHKKKLRTITMIVQGHRTTGEVDEDADCIHVKFNDSWGIQYPLPNNHDYLIDC